MTLRIVVDESVALARPAFSPLGEVETLPGRAIDAARVRDADLLVVRSITRVDERLLRGSRVRFVGTATIGTDHVDVDWLARRGIAFAAAPGSNARSVAEYVAAVLLELEAGLGLSLEGRTLGVVGVGHVGSRVVEMGRTLGMAVLLCDPPRAEREGGSGFVALEQILETADVVTLHTPLGDAGPHATRHLVGTTALERMKPGALLLNTARGAVVDNRALRDALAAGRIAAAALDVWEGEPRPDPELLRLVRVATPHVAGYSLDGKLAGTRMVAQAAFRFAGRADPPAARLLDVPVEGGCLTLRASGRDAVREAVRLAYPLREDDRRMRGLLALADAARGPAFDRLRRDYPVRRELHRYAVAGAALSPGDRSALARLGFRLT